MLHKSFTKWGRFVEYWPFVDYLPLIEGTIFVTSKLVRLVAAKWGTAVLGICYLWVSQHFGL